MWEVTIWGRMPCGVEASTMVPPNEGSSGLILHMHDTCDLSCMVLALLKFSAHVTLL